WWRASASSRTMLVESKKYVKPGASSCVSFEYSLESEGGPDVLFGEIVVLRHLLDAVATQIAVSDHVGGDSRSGDHRPTKANLGIDDDRRILVLGDGHPSRRSDPREEHHDPVPSAVDPAQQ